MISIGFYISKDSLNVAELSLSGSQPQILAINQQLFQDIESEEEKLKLLSKEIERIEKQYKGKNIRLCYSLSQNLVSNFLIEFPFKEKFKILKTIPFEIEDKTPFQMDKICFDARICKIKDKNKSSVLVFVTPEENVKKIVSFLKPLKRNIYLLSCSSSALANLLETWQSSLSKRQNPNPDSAYLYIGIENSLVLLYKDGFLNHVSVLDWGCREIIEEMKVAYKLEKEKAYEEFFTKAFILTQVKGFTKEQRFFSDLIKKKVQALVPELKLLKLSLETKKNQTFSKLIIFGPGSMIKNLSVFLTEEIDLPVSKLNSFLVFPKFDLQSKALTDIALGLALEGLKKSPYTGLNFLQSKKKTAFSLFPKKWRKTALAVLVCFFIFSIYAFIRQFESSSALKQVDELFSDYGVKIANLRKKEVDTQSIKDFLALEKQKKEDEKIVKEYLNLEQPMDFLQLLSQKIGSAEKWSLNIQYLNIKDKKVEIKGKIKQDSLESFKSLLQSLSAKPIKENKRDQMPSAKEKEMTESPDTDKTKKADTDQMLSVKEKETSKNKKPDIDKKAGTAVEPQKPETDKIKKADIQTDLSKADGLTFFSYSFSIKKEL